MMRIQHEVGNVLLGNDGGVDVVLDGVVLRGQAKGIKADGEQHIVTLHPLLAADDVHGGEGTGVAHMEALTGGIGELDEVVELLPGLVPGDGGEGLFLQPLLLPFLFNGGKIVLQDVYKRQLPMSECVPCVLPCFHTGHCTPAFYSALQVYHPHS